MHYETFGFAFVTSINLKDTVYSRKKICMAIVVSACSFIILCIEHYASSERQYVKKDVLVSTHSVAGTKLTPYMGITL